jgi:hypothetical protein
MTRDTFRRQIEYRGPYPAVLTTDGTEYAVEMVGSYDEWRANDTVIAHLANSDSLPSYTECERRRRTVKAGMKTRGRGETDSRHTRG